MKFNHSMAIRAAVLLTLLVSLTVLSTRLRADTGSCGGATTTLPFTDVQGNPFFCLIAQAYFSGLTAGTSATTYSPGANVTREQMAAFITRTMDQSLKRGSQRAVADKWFTPQDTNSLTLTDIGDVPQLIEFDGTDLWAATFSSNSIIRVNPGDGKVLGTWTGATNAFGILAAMGKVFVTADMNPGGLYMIEPTEPAGPVSILTSSLGSNPLGIAFDGSRIWTANNGSVSIVTLNPTTVNTVTTGFSRPQGILYDGSHIWVTDNTADTLLKLNPDGSIAQTINVGGGPLYPVFDGTNIWVPNFNSSSVTVVRVKDAGGNPLASAFELATLTDNGLANPITLAFDGERILVTNFSGNSISLWKAADLTPLDFFSTGDKTFPLGACSDGLNFWITLSNTSNVARF